MYYVLRVPRLFAGITLGGCRLKQISRPWRGAPFKATTHRRVSFKAKMLGFGAILDNFGPKAAQILQIVSFGIILDYFGPKVTQILQMISFGTILDHFGSKVARKVL